MAFLKKAQINSSQLFLNRLNVLYAIIFSAVLCAILLVAQNQKNPSSPITNYNLSATDLVDGSLNNNRNQDDPKILKYIREYHLKPPSTGAYNLTPTTKSNNEKWNNTMPANIIKLLRNKTYGFFVECGANDGEFLSSTLFMELEYGWTGLLVEAGPDPLEVLMERNRKAWIANACLSTRPHPHMVEILRHMSLNGVNYSRDSYSNVSNSDNNNPVKVKVQCFPLFSILSALNVTEVDYFNLNIGGSELEILKTFPFDGPIRLKIISVEVSLDKVEALAEFLTSKGYRLSNIILESFVHALIFVHPSVPYL